MNKPQPHNARRAPQIVPKGYWTFWCVLSIWGGIVGIVTAVSGEMKYDGIIGVLSAAWSISWAVVYWRIKHATKAA